MNAYLVSYQLARPAASSNAVEAQIKAHATYFRVQDSVWIIVTGQSARDISAGLKRHLGTSDQLFVVRLFREASWGGFSPQADKWLADYF